MVPSGWEVKTLENIAKITSGGTPSKTNLDYWQDGTVPWIRTTEVQNCIIRPCDTKVFITELGLKKSSAKLFSKGTILLAMIGQGKTRGQVALLDFEACSNQNCAAIILNKNQHPEYYYNYLLSQYQNIRNFSNSAGQSNLSGGLIKSILVPIPPLPEQRKIANILATWDKAISTTERLIDNSKQQKKALMQQLLTGKKRLLDDSGKPFEGEWNTRKLSELFTFSTSSSKTKFIDESGDNYILDMGSVSRSGKLIPTKKTKISQNYLSKGQLVMPKDDIGGGQIIGRVGYVDKSEKYILSDHVYCLTPKSGSSLFYSYLINSHKVNKQLRRQANGTAQLGLGKKDAEKQPVYIPKEITEQYKIAATLINNDKEVDLLEKQLSDLKQEKKALMQQLLTGKRRVKVDNTEAA